MEYIEDFKIGDHGIHIYENDVHEKFGECLTEVWRKDGEIDSFHDRPAVIVTSLDGRALVQEWYHKGMLHRDAVPARIEHYRYSNERFSIREEWYQNDICTRLDGPAIKEVCSDGLVAEEHWMVNGLEHRTDGPSYVDRDYETHIVLAEHWMQNGEFFRKDGPVYTERLSPSGRIVAEEYMDDENQTEPEQPSP
jgi:hypothetical protein